MRPEATWAAALGVMLVIFWVDTVTPYEVAVSVFHTAPLLWAARAAHRKALPWLAGAAMVLTVTSFMLTAQGDYRAGLINTALSVTAIASTAWLILKRLAAERASQAAQRQLARAARLRPLHSLAATLAHEINQPLAAVVTSAHASLRWLDRQPPDTERARQALARVAGEAQRAGDILARVRNLAQGIAGPQVAFDLNQAVHQMLELAMPTLRDQGIDVSQALASDLPAAVADPIQVQQVISNLLLNAAQAMAQQPVRLLGVRTWQEGQLLNLSITDTGHGFPKQVQARLFDAFWSNRPGGLGIGLSLCRTLIEANGGQIDGQPGASVGAVFTFTLPAQTQACT